MRILSSLLLIMLVLPVFASQTIGSYQALFEERMEKMKNKKSSWTEEDRLVMKQASEALAKSLPNPGLQVGEKAPNFTLTNALGQQVSLAESLVNGPVILVFYRGAWCPYCNLHLHALKNTLPTFEKYNATLLTVTPQTPDKSAAQFKKDGYPFEVLSDMNNQVMQEYKLFFQPSEKLVNIYKKYGLDLESFNGKGRSGLPIPGTFVINQNGIVSAMQAEVDYTSRMEPAAIVDALKALSDAE